MKFKLLALDIDKTVVEQDSMSTPKEVKEALKKASEVVKIAFITARGINEFLPFLDSLNLPASWHAVENGAKIIDPKGNLEYDLSIPHAEVQEIIDIARPYYLDVGFLADQYWRDDLFTLGEDNTITGISFTCVSEINARLIEKSLSELSHQYAVYVDRHWTSNKEWRAVLIFHKDAEKGKALHYIQRQLGVDKSQTIAAGDGATDISMFSHAVLKVTVADAEQEIKDQSDFVMPQAKDYGIIEFINKYIL